VINLESKSSDLDGLVFKVAKSEDLDSKLLEFGYHSRYAWLTQPPLLAKAGNLPCDSREATPRLTKEGLGVVVHKVSYQCSYEWTGIYLMNIVTNNISLCPWKG